MNNEKEFEPGTSVVYGFHGICQVIGVEGKKIGNEELLLYKLERERPTLSRSQKNQAAIWLPVKNAKALGLRMPMTPEQAQTALEALESREYYFSFKPERSWQTHQNKLETAIKTEGGLGLAKALSFLHVYKKKQIVADAEVIKFQEMIQKLLIRELSDVLGQPARMLEERITKSLRHKILLDQ